MNKIVAAVKKMREVMKKAVLPRTVSSFDEISPLFKRRGVTSVTVELACYRTIAGPYKLTADYIGAGKKKRVVRREVLQIIEDHDADVPLLMKEMGELLPSIMERAEKLRKELGVPVTIPEKFAKEFAASSPPHEKKHSDAVV